MSLQHFWDGEATRPAGGTVRASRARSGSTPAPSHPLYIIRTASDWANWLAFTSHEFMVRGERSQRWLQGSGVELKLAPADHQYLQIPRLRDVPCLAEACDDPLSTESYTVDTIEFRAVGYSLPLRMTAEMFFGCRKSVEQQCRGMSLDANICVEFRRKNLGWIRRALKEGMGCRFSNRRFRRTPISVLRQMAVRYRVLNCRLVLVMYGAFEPKDRIVYIQNQSPTMLGFEYVAAERLVRDSLKETR